MPSSRLFLPIVSALIAVSIAPAQTPVTFLQPENLGACSSIAAADFNGDGNLDVACAADTITIWLGNGKGGFTRTSQEFALPSAQIVSGDFNGDGIPDLVVANSQYQSTTGQIALLLGNGDGTFGPLINVSDIAATALAVIQPSPTGPLGLVVVEEIYDTVAVLLGNGDGTFQNPISTNLVATANVAVADFNGDGVPDIACIGEVGYNTYSIQVALGSSDGTFGTPILTTLPSGVFAYEDLFTAGDFTGNGIVDVAWSDSNNLYVYLASGNGSFTAGPVTSAPASPVLLAADLNGDGLADIVMENMAVALSKGGGEFAPPQWYQNVSGAGGVAGNFRNLKVPDLIVAGDYYANIGSGTFRAPRSYPVQCEECSLATGDFNNDGNLDAVVAGEQDIRVYAGNGGGDFTGFVQTNISLPEHDLIYGLAAADFNNDGNLDLVAGTSPRGGTSAQVLLLLGNGNNTFQSPTTIYQGYSVYALATADFNQSGNMGVAIATEKALVVMCGNGAGKFTTTATITGIANTNSVVVADFNGDGIPDLATGSDVYLGNGDGTFRHSFALSDPAEGIFIGDFNGDGKIDLLTSSMVYWPGLGNGTFGAPIAIPSEVQPLAVADLNGDGISDIFAGYYEQPAIIYLGTPKGTFTEQTVNGLPPALEDSDNPALVGKFTKSALPDLLMVASPHQLLVLINSTK